LVFVGSADGSLYALDRLTGSEQWHFDADGPILSSPAVADGKVIFGSLVGSFFAVDATSGAPVWRLSTGTDRALPWGHESGDFYTSSPVVDGATAVFGSGDGSVYAVDVNDGRERWHFATHGRVRSSPAIDGGIVFVGSQDGSIYAIDLESGQLRWRYDTEGSTLNSAQFGFDRRTIQSSPAVAEGAVYVGSRDGYLYALDEAKGTLRWRYNYDQSWEISSPAVVDRVVYAATSDGQFFHAIDAAAGKEIWRVRTTGVVWSSPSLDRATVYVGDGSGFVWAVDRTTGGVRWRFLTGGGIWSSPVIDGDLLYVGSNDGGVYALRGAADQGLRRAVFWDSALVRGSRFPGHRTVRDFFIGHGYQLVDGNGLAKLLQDCVRTRVPCVIVFALDQLPKSLAVHADSGMVSRYLRAGGKIVWTGDPPMIWPKDATGNIDYSLVDRASPASLLGIDFTQANFDLWGVVPTKEGRQWGLQEWWQAAWGIAPTQVTALGLNETGLAAGWVRSYGGPPGTGFVYVGRPRWTEAELEQLVQVAEYRPLVGTPSVAPSVLGSK